jgi:hypothetical protein
MATLVGLCLLGVALQFVVSASRGERATRPEPLDTQSALYGVDIDRRSVPAGGAIKVDLLVRGPVEPEELYLSPAAFQTLPELAPDLGSWRTRDLRQISRVLRVPSWVLPGAYTIRVAGHARTIEVIEVTKRG